MSEEEFKQLSDAVVNGDLERAVTLTCSILENGTSPKEIILNGLTPGMYIVGEKFEKGEIFLSDMLSSAMIFEEVMNILKPRLSSMENKKEKKIGKVVIGTIEGDLHSIGKNLVAIMLQVGGFDVIDLGEDVSANKFSEAVKEESPDILGISALLSTTAENIKKVIHKLKDDGIRDKVKIIIGGAPIDEEFAKKIGADGYGRDAFIALEIAKKLVSRG